MAEVRTTSSTGGEKGVKPQRYGLLPRRGLDAIAEVFAFGATKYADNNWRRGYEWDKSFDALLRHAYAAQDGETYDEESGLPHLAHAGFHVLVLLTWLYEQGEGPDNLFDTRWPAGMERARRELETGRERLRRVNKIEEIRKDLVDGLEPYTDEECNRQDGPVVEEPWPIPEDWTPIGFVDESQVFEQANLDDFISTVNEDVVAMATYSFPARFVAGPHGTEDREADSMEVRFPSHEEFAKNLIAVRRNPAYDEEWLREVLPEPFVTDFKSGDYTPSRWERG